MESDDDYESSSFINIEPSPSPKHYRLKRLRKSAIEPNQSVATESVSELLGLPKVDFAKLEALESSDIKAFGHDLSPRSSELDDALNLNNDDCRKEKELTSCFDDTDNTRADINRKESKIDSEFEESFDDDDSSSSRKEKELRSCFDDTRVVVERKENEADLKFDESFDDDVVVEKKLKTDRKETKRALEFDDDDLSENLKATDVKIRNVEVNEFVEDAVNEKKRKKKKRAESGGDDSNSKAISVKRMAKERKAHLEQLHAESQRLLRETRGVSFKAVPLVQKPISSILEKIRQRKLEVSKKFSQLDDNDSGKEDDGCVKQDVMDNSKGVEMEDGDLSNSVKEDKVSSVSNEDLETDGVCMDSSDASIKRKRHDKDCSQMALDEESTSVLRAPVDDTQELFGSQTSNDKESENDESCENTSSSHEEEMQPSLLAMKLKFDSALDDDMSDEEEENDKENVAPHSSPTGDPVKAFVDVEAEEEDDSDNDRMRFGDDDEDEDDDDIEELNKMIATGYKERPIDLETRNELHQKWLEEKDAAGTDDLLRRLNVTSKLRDASLLDDDDGEQEEEEEGEDQDQDQDDVDMNNDVDEDLERPRVGRIDSKTAKELIAQMFIDKDDDYLSSDDEQIEKIVARERMRNKAGDKGKLVSPFKDKDSSEVFGLIKKLNTVPEVRKRAKTTSFFDTMLTGGNSNSSSKSSFLSRASSHSFSSSSKQGRSSGARSFIFGRDDSNSRSSISVSEDTSDTTISKEIQTKKVTTTKYSSSQLQARSSTQTTKLVTETNSTASFFEILKNASVQSSVRKQNHEVEISQSAFATFKIPKKPVINPWKGIVNSSSRSD